jgi:hypothetical protein
MEEPIEGETERQKLRERIWRDREAKVQRNRKERWRDAETEKG